MKKSLKVFGICTIVIIGILIALYIRHNKGGTVIHCTSEYAVNKSLIAYRQDDKAWKDSKLGNSFYTLGSSGCVVTSITSALSVSPLQMTPKEFNRLLSEKNVYDDEGNLQWGMLEQIEGLHADVYTEVSSDIIDTCLNNGKYPIIKVHQNNLFSYHHYILVIGAQNGEYICMDPLQDNLTKLSDYDNKVYAIRCVWYE